MQLSKVKCPAFRLDLDDIRSAAKACSRIWLWHDCVPLRLMVDVTCNNGLLNRDEGLCASLFSSEVGEVR